MSELCCVSPTNSDRFCPVTAKDMRKEEKALVDVLEEILEYDPLTNASGYPCHMCGRRQTQGHYSKCPFVKAQKALESWHAEHTG